MSNELSRYRQWNEQARQVEVENPLLARMRTPHPLAAARLKTYQSMLYEQSGQRTQKIFDLEEYIKTLTQRPDNAVIVDAGAGAGYAAEDIQHIVGEKGRVLAVDTTKHPHTRKTLTPVERMQFSYFHLKEALLENGASDGADLIVCMRSFFPQVYERNVPEWQQPKVTGVSYFAQKRLLREFARCLKPGGVALATMEMTDENIRQMRSFQEDLQEKGYILEFSEMAANARERNFIGPVYHRGQNDAGKMMVAVLQRN